MVRALLYLRLQSLGNALRRRAGRLAQPRYLIAALVAVAYFYYFLFRPMGAVFRGGSRDAVPMAMVLVSALFMAVLLLARPVMTWLGQGGLAFSEAEIAFLFPAPATRRTLIQYHLLQSQLSTLVSAVFFSILSQRWVFLGGTALTRTLGWWVIFATLSMHQTAAALTIAALEERGVQPARRRAVVLGAITLFFAGVVFSVWQNARLPRPADFASGLSFQGYVTGVLNAGWMPWLLWPIKLVARPFLARNTAYFLLHLEPALLILAAHYVWALRMDGPFEESSIALAQRRSRAIASRQGGAPPWATAPRRGLPEPFRLAGRGRPEVAFLWKNLLSLRSSVNWRMVAMPALMTFYVGLTVFAHGGRGDRGPWVIVGMACLAFYTLLIGPQYARQDLRSDLHNADILKTYPLAGWQVVLAEMLAPAGLLTCLMWAYTLAAAVALKPGMAGWLTPGVRISAAACLAAIAPAFCLLQLVVPNAAMLLFPAWHQATRARRGGVEVAGQRLIFFFGQLLLFLVALLPAAVSALLLFAASSWAIGVPAALALAAASVLAILGGEIAVAVWWLGGRFEKFDLSSELPT